MQSISHQEAKFQKRLQHILNETDLSSRRALVERLCQRLGIEPLDCAAALLALTQPQFKQAVEIGELAVEEDTGIPEQPAQLLQSPRPLRLVCYRLDVGSVHQVLVDDIKDVLVEESGVERSRIGRVDIYPHYTLVELPEGMPADVFQLLTETELASRKLNIKRVKPQRRNHFRVAKKSRQHPR